MHRKKILCPVDFSPGSQHAMEVAVRIAIESGAELVLAHAWQMPPLVAAGDAPLPADWLQVLVEDEERGLAEAQREATRLGVARVATRFLRGVAWDRIVATLDEDPDFDLVVLGTHGRTGLGRFLLGSVAEMVTRHAPCPVLAVRRHDDRAGFRHVLCTVDFSDSSRDAVELATEVAAASGDGIVLLHVVEAPSFRSDKASAMEPGDLEQRASRLLDQWAARLAEKTKVPVKVRLAKGDPAAQILAVLEEDATFDLLVTGSHGRTGLRRVLLGSVAEKVLRHAPCSVLIARGPRART